MKLKRVLKDLSNEFFVEVIEEIKSFSLDTLCVNDSAISVNAGDCMCIWFSNEGALLELECISPKVLTDIPVCKGIELEIGLPLFDYKSSGKEVAIYNSDNELFFVWGDIFGSDFISSSNGKFYISDGELVGVSASKFFRPPKRPQDNK